MCVAKIKRPRQHYPLVEVWWDDATDMPSGWIEAIEEIEVKPCIILTIGFLVKETDDYVIVALDTNNGGHNGRSQIPKGMIRNMKIIKKADVTRLTAVNQQTS
jgi:hypothetical protein